MSRVKTYEEINQKLKSGKAVVLTAEEVAKMALECSPEEIVEKVDVVTTATFGAMCSSGEHSSAIFATSSAVSTTSLPDFSF